MLKELHVDVRAPDAREGRRKAEKLPSCFIIGLMAV